MKIGGLAQLARASALHAEGQRFESVILHSPFFRETIFDMMVQKVEIQAKSIYQTSGFRTGT